MFPSCQPHEGNVGLCRDVAAVFRKNLSSEYPPSLCGSTREAARAPLDSLSYHNVVFTGHVRRVCNCLAVRRFAKGGLLPCERPSFARRKAAFCSVVCRLLRSRMSSDVFLIVYCVGCNLTVSAWRCMSITLKTAVSCMLHDMKQPFLCKDNTKK